MLTIAPMAHAQKEVTIDSGRFDFIVRKGASLLVFEDTTDQLNFKDVLEENPFQSKAKGPNKVAGTYWLKLTLLNMTSYDRRVVLSGLRSIDGQLYMVNNGEVFSASFGSFIKKSELNNGDGRFHVSFNLKAGAPQDLFIRVNGYAFKPRFTDAQTFFSDLATARIRDFLFFGACLILIFYSLIQFVVHKYTPFLLLAMFAFGMAMYAFSVQDYFVDWFFPQLPEIGVNFTMPWSQFGHLGMLLLAIRFLELKMKFPLLHKIFYGLIGLTVVRMVLGVWLTAVYQNYGLMTDWTIKLLFIDIAVFVVMLFGLWNKVNKSRKIFLVGLVLFGLALIVASFAWMYIFQSKAVVLFYTTSLASLSQILVFSIALGVEMRQHEVEKNIALDELNSVLKAQNLKIELEVLDRTKEIKKQKKLLTERNERIETLFREIHHRVKNNLQLISSLLNMQQEWSTENDPINAIEESRNRVVAMSMIHQFLYRTDDIANIYFKDYVVQLVNKLNAIQAHKVDCVLDTRFKNNPVFDIDTSISLGLILNELVTNSYKYAVREKEQLVLTLILEEEINGMFSLIYQDNGPPILGTFDEVLKRGFGLRLASRLSKQLQGKLGYEYFNGNRFVVDFASEELRAVMAE